MQGGQGSILGQGTRSHMPQLRPAQPKKTKSGLLGLNLKKKSFSVKVQ